jgi:hypothetical protein
MARVVAVFGPPRWVGRDVMRFSDVSYRMMCSSSLRPGMGAAGVPRNALMRLVVADLIARTMAPSEPGMTLVGVAPRHRR